MAPFPSLRLPEAPLVAVLEMIPSPSEDRRYDYPDITPRDIVIDAGAYQGNWSRAIADKYHCTVWAFEPVARFYKQACDRNIGCDHVVLFDAGLGAAFCSPQFNVRNDSSGLYATSDEKESVRILPVVQTLLGDPGTVFALLKLNVEGMEYEILEAILDAGCARNFRHYQIQFHAIPGSNFTVRWQTIRNRLSETHELEYAEPDMAFHEGTWEGWKPRE